MISSNRSHLALLAVLLFAAHLQGNLAADDASEDVVDDTMNDTTTDLSSLLDVDLAVEDKAKMVCWPHACFNHFVKLFKRLFYEKMPDDKCSRKSAPGGGGTSLGFEQDVAMQQGWSPSVAVHHHTPPARKRKRKPHCVCIKNDEGNKFCCTRKTSTAQFIWQFTLWSIRSCTASFRAAANCLWYAQYFSSKVYKVLKCFVKKSHQALASGSLNEAIAMVWKDIQASFGYMFGEELEMNMLDGGHTALTLGREDLNTYEKRLYHVTKAFLQASEDVLHQPPAEDKDVSPRDADRHSLDKLLDEHLEAKAGWDCG